MFSNLMRTMCDNRDTIYLSRHLIMLMAEPKPTLPGYFVLGETEVNKHVER